MRVCLAREIMYKFSSGKSLQESVDASLELMRQRVDGFGGAIAVGNDGQIGIGFTTEMMPWAYINSNHNESVIHYGINSGQHFTEKFWLFDSLVSKFNLYFSPFIKLEIVTKFN